MDLIGLNALFFNYFLDNILEIHRDNTLFYIKIFKIRVFKKVKKKE